MDGIIPSSHDSSWVTRNSLINGKGVKDSSSNILELKEGPHKAALFNHKQDV